MIDAFQSGFGSLIMGFSLLTIENMLMIAVGYGLLWLGIRNMNTTYFVNQVLRIQFH